MSGTGQYLTSGAYSDTVRKSAICMDSVRMRSSTLASSPGSQGALGGRGDSLGRRTLANVLSQIKYDGAVATCGLAQGPDLPVTVMPFVLRDVTLAGVNSVLTPREKREEAWGHLATDLDLAKLNSMTTRATLDDVPSLAAEILAGKTRGRVVIDL